MFEVAVDCESEIRQQLLESAELKTLIAEQLSGKILQAALLIHNCFRHNGKVILFGNGGSAADAQHLAAEFVGRFKMERDVLPAIALSVNTSIITALGNDYGFDLIFSRQIEAWARTEDIVVGISTSGNSVNVLEGMKKAKELGAKTIGLTGAYGGKLTEVSDLVIAVPSSETCRIQEGHITIGHIICYVVERILFGVRR